MLHICLGSFTTCVILCICWVDIHHLRFIFKLPVFCTHPVLYKLCRALQQQRLKRKKMYLLVLPSCFIFPAFLSFFLPMNDWRPQISLALYKCCIIIPVSFLYHHQKFVYSASVCTCTCYNYIKMLWTLMYLHTVRC